MLYGTKIPPAEMIIWQGYVEYYVKWYFSISFSFVQVRIDLRDIRSFEKREINVNLLHQDDNGHVRKTSIFILKKFYLNLIWSSII